jgi:hypothetical protein
MSDRHRRGYKAVSAHLTEVYCLEKNSTRFGALTSGLDGDGHRDIGRTQNHDYCLSPVPTARPHIFTARRSHQEYIPEKKTKDIDFFN